MKAYTATCDDCGYTATSKTHGNATRGLRMHSCDKHRERAASRERRLAREAAVDKTPKPCHHKQTTHVHGTHACYVLDRCRCAPCSSANAAYEQQRAKTHAYGRWDRHWVDATQARTHVEQLRAAGLGLKTIAERAGISHSSLGKLIYGHKGRPPTERISRANHDRILTVQATIDTLADGAVIDGTGTRRRLQALMTLGWSQSRLAAAIGFEIRNFAFLIHGKRGVTVATAKAVRDLYERLWDQRPPQGNRWERSAYTRSLNYAQQHGWTPPLSWDEETLDDPNAVPDLGEQETASRGRPVEHIAEDVEFLLRHEPLATAEQLAHRLDYRDASGIQIALKRAERPDLLGQLARNADLARPGRGNTTRRNAA